MELLQKDKASGNLKVWLFRTNGTGRRKMKRIPENYLFVFMLCTIESLNLLFHEERAAYF